MAKNKLASRLNPNQKHDWEALYKEFGIARRKEPRLELKEWAGIKGLGYSYASKQFTHLAHLLTGEKLALLAPGAADRLGRLLDSASEDMAYRSSTAIIDRTGHSPAAVTMTINQQTNIQFAIPPLFGADYAGKVNKLIRPVVIDVP